MAGIVARVELAGDELLRRHGLTAEVGRDGADGGPTDLARLLDDVGVDLAGVDGGASLGHGVEAHDLHLALLAGLVLIARFNLPWLDPVMSILVACYILFESLRLMRHGLRDVLDEQLPETVRKQIEGLIEDHKHELFGYHNLRTRRAGSQKLIDFHLTVCKHLSVEEAHDITDYIEKKIGDQIIGTDVTIHVEPCRRHDCPGRDVCPAQLVRHAGDQRVKWWQEGDAEKDREG